MYVCTCCVIDSSKVKDGTGNDVRVLCNHKDTSCGIVGHKSHDIQHEYRYFNHAIHADQCGIGCI